MNVENIKKAQKIVAWGKAEREKKELEFKNALENSNAKEAGEVYLYLKDLQLFLEPIIAEAEQGEQQCFCAGCENENIERHVQLCIQFAHYRSTLKQDLEKNFYNGNYWGTV